MSICAPLQGSPRHPSNKPSRHAIPSPPRAPAHRLIGCWRARAHAAVPTAVAPKALVPRSTGNPAKLRTPTPAMSTCPPTQAHPSSPQHGTHHAIQAPRSPKPFPGALPGYSPPSWSRSSLGTPGAVSPDAHPPHHGHLRGLGEAHGGLSSGGVHGPRVGASGAAPPRGGGSTMQALPGSVQMLNSVLGQPLRRTESARWGTELYFGPGAGDALLLMSGRRQQGQWRA